MASTYHIDKVKIQDDVLDFLAVQDEFVFFQEIFDYILAEVPKTQKQTKYVLGLNLRSVLNTLIKQGKVSTIKENKQHLYKLKTT